MGKADKRARKREKIRRARQEREAAAKKAKLRRQFGIGAVAIVLVVGIVAVFAATGSDTKKTPPATTAASTATTANTATTTAGPKIPNPMKPVSGPVATITTNLGIITVQLDSANSPIATKHFVDLVKAKFYDGLTFHRASKNFVIQGGDPQGDGSGTPKSVVVGEVPTDHYPLGSIAAAKTGNDPAGTFGNQFFIVTGSNGATLPNDYARWGKVVSGLDVAQKIEALAPASGDGAPTKPVKIVSITVAGA